jgi:L-arabinose isomerase
MDLAGGAHHTGFSTSINSEYLEDFAGMMGVEYVLIGGSAILLPSKMN